MKTILLLRHGKSDWDADYIGDHSRPLAERGEKGARKMGRFLTTARVSPDRALSSTAERARQTLAIAAEAGGWTGPARITDALYEATPQSILAEIQTEDDAAQTLIVVGHEPTHSGLVSLLIGGLSVLTPLLLFTALGLPLGLKEAILLHLITSIGSVPPTTPARLGVFEWLVVFMLAQLGEGDENLRLSYALLYHSVVLLPQLTLGAVALAQSRWRRLPEEARP